MNKINSYKCLSCAGITVTLDIHEGTTPFMIECTKCHKGLAESSFYRKQTFMDADLIFYRPRTGKHVDSDHVKQGGLITMETGRRLDPLMKCQTQPNQATCFVTAFAIALGVPVAELIEQIGHDGLEVIHKGNPKPYCYRGHHTQELIFACFQRGYAVTQFEPLPTLASLDSVVNSPTPWWFEQMMACRQGVLIGEISPDRIHTLAWSPFRVCDPAFGYPISTEDFRIRMFLAITPFIKD